MHKRGFWLSSWETPVDVAIQRWDGTRVMLNDDGTITLL
jgi:hypothetical protein